jgi:hypothetical protein
MQAVHIPAHMFGLVRQMVKLGRHDSVDIPVLIWQDVTWDKWNYQGASRHNLTVWHNQIDKNSSFFVWMTNI